MGCRTGTGRRTMTATQVAALVEDPPTGSTTAEWVAKSRTESSHRPDCEHTPGDAVGLFGIRSTHWRTSGIATSEATYREMLKSPGVNVREAFRLFRDDRNRGGNGWRPWAASGGRPTPNAEDRAASAAVQEGGGDPHGGGTEYIPPDDEGIDLTPGVDVDLPSPGDVVDSVAGAIGGLVNILSSIVDTVGAVAGWVSDRHNWLRVVLVVGGGAAGIAALLLAVRPQIERSIPG